MCSLILLSLYANDLLKYKDGVIKNMLPEFILTGFEFIRKNVLRKNFIYKEKLKQSHK